MPQNSIHINKEAEDDIFGSKGNVFHGGTGLF